MIKIIISIIIMNKIDNYNDNAIMIIMTLIIMTKRTIIVTVLVAIPLLTLLILIHVIKQ